MISIQILHTAIETLLSVEQEAPYTYRIGRFNVRDEPGKSRQMYTRNADGIPPGCVRSPELVFE